MEIQPGIDAERAIRSWVIGVGLSDSAECRHNKAFALGQTRTKALEVRTVPGSAARVLRLQSSLLPRCRAGLPEA